jgi:L-ascorbate metabolism protein UlaG (beta-lactamase superfamily)
VRVVKRFFTPDHIVPMHFGTFPGLSDEAAVKKAFASLKQTTVMRPGEVKVF